MKLLRPSYRPDIDGLRALAVLSVIAYHAFPNWMRGGFIGVDVFFVISGYLITTIILENLNQENFSFKAFYARRVKRIFPSLTLVLASCMTLGWCVLLADEYSQLGKHVAASAGFLQNIVLWRESGYFDNTAETKPLLHIWSLGIEEQFYLVWPLLCWAAWKRKYHFTALIFALALVSFALNVYIVGADAIAAFYSPFTRFWELLVGGLLARDALNGHSVANSARLQIGRCFTKMTGRVDFTITEEAFANGLSFTGLFLLAWGLWHISKSVRFPGAWALAPVLGAALMLGGSAQKAWLNRTILSHKIIVWFGLISFPLYLWHWSLLSFARIVQSETPNPFVRIAIILLSILLAWLSYAYVEKPIRFGRSGKTKIAALVLLMIAVGCFGLSVYLNDGFSSRSAATMNASIKTGDVGGARTPLMRGCGTSDEELINNVAYCVIDPREPVRYALLGDSKAATLFPGLVRTSDSNGRWLFIGGNGPNGSPIPLLSHADIYKRYEKLSAPSIMAIANNKEIEKVVLVVAARVLFQLAHDEDLEELPSSQNYDVALEGLKKAVEIFVQARKDIVFLVDNPTLPHPEDCLNRQTTIGLVNAMLVKENPKCKLPLERHRALSALYRKLLAEVQASYPGSVRIFDTTKYFCDMEAGVCQSRKNGHFLYSYTDHMSDYAAGLIGEELNAFLASY